MDWHEVMRRLASRLRDGGVPDAEREAQHILQWATGQTFGEWVVRGGVVPEPDLEGAESALARRLAGEPWAYITGHREFFGLDLLVSPDVLIPRPDTETLVQWVLECFDGTSLRVADIGCGSGAIALALAYIRPEWTIVGADISPAALAVARANGERLGFPVTWLVSDLLAEVPRNLEVIVANLPYVDPVSDSVSREVRFEPPNAIFAADRGLAVIKRLVSAAPDWLSPTGQIFLECGWDQAQTVSHLLTAVGFEGVMVRRDYAGHDRVVAGRLGRG